MPLFEYRCDSCQKDFERLELAGRRVENACPHCGSGKATRKISVFSAHAPRGASAPACDSGPCGGGGCGSGEGCGL